MKIAVVGTGSAGIRHLKAAQYIDGLDPIAVPKRESRRSELEAEGFVTAPNLGAAVSHGVSAAIIATDTAKHVEDAVSALSKGLDILVEKPLAVDAIEAHRLCQGQNDLDRRIYVGCFLRFSESLNKFRQSIDDIGRLHSVRIECQSYLPCWRPDRHYQDTYSARSEEGGVLLDLIHEIDYAGWIFGWPDACQAQLRNLGRLEISAEETADLTWETSSGCLVSVNLDYLTRPPRRQVRAYGEWGTAEWDALNGMVTVNREGAPTQTTTDVESALETSVAMMNAFVAACNGGEDSRLATCEDGCRALAVCDAARRSSHTRQEERVEYL